MLELLELAQHEVHDLERQTSSIGLGNRDTGEVEQEFVHAVDADRVEMVGPVEPVALLDCIKVVARIGVESCRRQVLDDLALDLERRASDVHDVGQALEQLVFAMREVADTWEVDGDHPNGAGERIGRKQSAAPLAQFARVEPQTTAH